MEYTSKVENITAAMLSGGFFVGWPNPPSPTTHLAILQNSYRSWIAIDTTKTPAVVVGFVNAVSDGVLSAYIPLLEVLPTYQGQGIGQELVRRMLADLSMLYMVDVAHDVELVDYYAKFGASPSQASIFRNYEAQSGFKTSEP